MSVIVATINRAIRMMEDNGLTTRSLIVLQIVRLTFKILHAAIEVVPDFGPPKLENENQDGNCNGTNDQDCLKTHCTPLVLVNAGQQFSRGNLHACGLFRC